MLSKKGISHLTIYICLLMENKNLTQCNVFWLVICLCGASLMKGGT